MLVIVYVDTRIEHMQVEITAFCQTRMMTCMHRKKSWSVGQCNQLWYSMALVFCIMLLIRQINKVKLLNYISPSVYEWNEWMVMCEQVIICQVLITIFLNKCIKGVLDPWRVYWKHNHLWYTIDLFALTWIQLIAYI